MVDEILVVRHTLALAFYAVAIPCLFAACIFRIAYCLTVGLVIDAIRPRPKLACCLCLHLVAMYTVLR